jgi:formylglycine-generating enzyme required for sulfatase activity
MAVATLVGLLAAGAWADTFGSGANQFTLDFVPISGATNPTTGIPAGDGFTFTGVNRDYRMGAHEITNAQWIKFTASLGVPVTGSQKGYSTNFYDWGTGAINVPTNHVSWYECAQFVNWLNASTGHQAAYKFTGTQGTGDYTFAPWSFGDSGYDASNPYRNSNAYYFLPTEDEWVKAAFWNGTTLQTYATKAGESLTQGDGTGTGWNYYDNGYVSDPFGPWNVGSGSQELNGTYDMMGNNGEWMESPKVSGNYGVTSMRCMRSGYWSIDSFYMQSTYSSGADPRGEYQTIGFRVASVPEPGGIAMLLAAAAAGLL